ncbi:hypothetical protein IFM89_016540 [Coptis chinensis]|uniref:CCAAT-binding factor domain-containing protein n=1 Tax=Coptis chinensis TaxID=261450 RepID=A0A835INB6_9MAGN|nr:hypothetical protein IFM89_016540 [Coptis chinensis]
MSMSDACTPYLAAAFTKKLRRLSLVVPPSGALVVIAIIHNLLRRHPSISFLVQQEATEGQSEQILFCLYGSSLWEIDTLRHHYYPAVSRFVASLEDDLTVRAKTTEITVKDFSSASCYNFPELRLCPGPRRRLSLRLEASRLAPEGLALYGGLTESDLILASKINALDGQHLLRRKAAN